jgi:pimeloyl-ACP methyl ester carboxylesterase
VIDNRVDAEEEELASLRSAAELANLAIDEFVLPEDHDVVLGGMRFHYLDWGTNGPPILFLHGGGLTAHTYDLVCLALRGGYHCVSLDQRGHGDTEWSPVLDYSHESEADDVEALADQLGWSRFVLVGMSMGGLNSIVYAGRHSDRLAGLVIVDVGPELRPLGTGRIADFLSQPDALDSIDEFVARAVEFNPLRKPELLRRSLRHSLRQRPDGKWTWKMDRRPREQNPNAPLDPDRYKYLWADVDRIACPTLVLRGEKSDVFTDEDAEKLADRLTRGRWVKIPKAGHTIQGDNPAAMVAAMRTFLDEIGY